MKKINSNDYAIKLSYGKHKSPQEGMCVMECVAYISGEKHTDYPKCADYHCTTLAIKMNDCYSDNFRQQLLPFVLRLAGSATNDSTIWLERSELRIIFNNMTNIYHKDYAGLTYEEEWKLGLEVLDKMLELTDSKEELLVPVKALKELEQITNKETV